MQKSNRIVIGNPKCAPARACLVTGKYSWQLKEATNHWPAFPAEFKFYPHLLMETGYWINVNDPLVAAGQAIYWRTSALSIPFADNYRFH